MQQHQNYQELYELADQYYAKGHLEKSEELLIATLKQNPKFGPAFELLAKNSNNQGFADESKALQRFRIPECITLPDRLRKKYFKTKIDLETSDRYFQKINVFQEEQTELTKVCPSLESVNKYFSQTLLKSDPACLYSIQGGKAWIDGFNQIVWDESGNIIPKLCRGHAELINSIVSTREPEQLTGRVSIIANRLNRNYYHWLTDLVPALSVSSKAGLTTKDIDTFITSPTSTSFQQETWDLCNIPSDKQTVHHRQTYIQAEELVVSTWGSNTLGVKVGSWLSPELRNIFLQESDDTKGNEGNKIYISRGDSETRRIINEKTLTEILQNKYGFLIINTLDYTVQEQANLFSNAQYVLAAHGAALTNIHFCSLGTNVLEIFGDYVDPCFWILCNRIGLNHHFHQPQRYQAQQKGPKTNLGQRRKHDIVIDIDDLVRELDLWLN